MNDEMPYVQDTFESTFQRFVIACEALSQDAEGRCDYMGSYNTPYEIRLNVASSGLGVLRVSADSLTWEQAEPVLDLVAAVRRLP